MNNEITIQSDSEDIRTLIVKILGRGLHSSETTLGSFVLTPDEIYDLHKRILQRVQNQNDNQIVDFYCKYHFENSSTELIPNDLEFAQFRYLGNRRCISVELNYSFLVKFSGKGHEKQSLTITISTQHLDESGPLSKRSDSDRHKNSGSFTIGIEYTDYTWANDLRNLFSQYARERLDRHPFIDFCQWAANYGSPITEMSISFIAMISLMSLGFSGSTFDRKQEVARISELPADTMPTISAKIDYLINNSLAISQIPLITMGAAFLTPIVLVYLLRRAVAGVRPASYIILNDQHRSQMKAERNGSVRKFLMYAGGAVLTVALGVFAARFDAFLKAIGL